MPGGEGSRWRLTQQCETWRIRRRVRANKSSGTHVRGTGAQSTGARSRRANAAAGERGPGGGGERGRERERELHKHGLIAIISLVEP